MQQDQKEALAQGRRDSNTVNRYLELLKVHNPSGSRRTPEEIQRRLREIAVEADGATPVKQLYLAQERIDLERELKLHDDGDELREAEAAFMEVARDYAIRKGISYQAFRMLGVPSAVLRKAGVPR